MIPRIVRTLFFSLTSSEAELGLPSLPVLRGRGAGGEGDARATTALVQGFRLRMAPQTLRPPHPRPLSPCEYTGGEGRSRGECFRQGTCPSECSMESDSAARAERTRRIDESERAASETP